MVLHPPVIHALIDAGRVRLAEKSLNELASIGSLEPEAWACRIRLFILANRPEDALECIKSLLSADPSCPVASWYLPHVCYDLGQYDLALEAIDRLIAEMPGDGFLHSFKAKIMWENPRVPIEEVKSEIARAYAQNPDEPLARKIEFAMARDSHDRSGMKKIAAELLLIDPESEIAAEALAIYISESTSDELSAAFTALGRFPNNPRILNAIINGHVNRHPIMRLLRPSNFISKTMRFLNGDVPRRSSRLDASIGILRGMAPTAICVLTLMAYLAAGERVRNDTIFIILISLVFLNLALYFLAWWIEGLSSSLEDLLRKYYLNRGVRRKTQSR